MRRENRRLARIYNRRSVKVVMTRDEIQDMTNASTKTLVKIDRQRQYINAE